MSQQNLASEEAKICLSKSSFFGFSMVNIHFLQKVLKKCSSFRKKKNKKISITGGGGAGPLLEFSMIFFFEPFLYEINFYSHLLIERPLNSFGFHYLSLLDPVAISIF